MTSTHTEAFANYEHLITTRPHQIRRALISDLHLSEDEPAIVQAFLALLDDLIVLSNLVELYILGDWFDVWIGDDAYLTLSNSDKNKHWITPIIKKLTQLNHQGCTTFVMHGNRDFLITQKFCDTFGGKLIDEPYHLQISNTIYRLEHGDALCTDDVEYQRFRRIMRNRFVQWLLLKRPLKKRLLLANKIRKKSNQGKQTKPYEIMDVNSDAVLKAASDVDYLLHGHTHRPAIHNINERSSNNISLNKKTKFRYVLGDWRVINLGNKHEVEAVIGLSITDSGSTTSTIEAVNTTNEQLMLVNYSIKTV